MGNISFSVTGVDKLSKELLSRASAGDIKSVVKRNTTQMQQQTMSNASSVYTKGYSTGDTKKSIGISLKDSGMSGVAGLGMEYNQYTEVGTRFMAAEPLLKPVFNKQKTVFKSDLEKLLK
ncbi:HK97-gp10 family putative phage morphogenesis protein [Leuconostoc mesenteroides]|uniref:HK97-gp10 family putative phage morphogenesis protein n=1 Tax=Leuconostoc mesenteroides TaxID=1245 RepID=UPI000751679B|nr:HK97-gp10 family putative phage morphogenesis protein [Leuconostoc mesenteroides]